MDKQSIDDAHWCKLFKDENTSIRWSGTDRQEAVKRWNLHESLVKAIKTCVVALYAHPELSSRAEAEVVGQFEINN